MFFSGADKYIISTAGADCVAKMVKIQDNMAHPLADVMKRLGVAKNPTRSAKSADILQVIPLKHGARGDMLI